MTPVSNSQYSINDLKGISCDGKQRSASDSRLLSGGQESRDWSCRLSRNPAHLSGRGIPALNELLQMKPVFDASEDSFSFPASALSRPIVRGYADIERLFMLFPFDLLPPDYGDGRIADLIRFALRAGFARREAVPGMARLAEMFGLTPATLRRRIAGEGTTLTALRKACRMEAALDLLQGSNLSIKEIAASITVA